MCALSGSPRRHRQGGRRGTLKSFTLRIPDAQLAEIDRRAKLAGHKTRTSYIIACLTGDDIRVMLQEVHRAVVGRPVGDDLSDEALGAVQALEIAGMTPNMARKRVVAVVADQPGLDSAEIIRKALIHE